MKKNKEFIKKLLLGSDNPEIPPKIEEALKGFYEWLKENWFLFSVIIAIFALLIIIVWAVRRR